MKGACSRLSRAWRRVSDNCDHRLRTPRGHCAGHCASERADTLAPTVTSLHVARRARLAGGILRLSIHIQYFAHDVAMRLVGRGRSMPTVDGSRGSARAVLPLTGHGAAGNACFVTVAAVSVGSRHEAVLWRYSASQARMLQKRRMRVELRVSKRVELCFLLRVHR